MRHYDRINYRHLNDSGRYRDYDYLADDGWVGPNERVPHGMTAANEPPWSTLHGYETGALLDDERAFDERRGQGREYGRDLGLGYGREHDMQQTFERSSSDDYDRGYGRPRDRGARLEVPREGFELHGRAQQRRPRAAHARRSGGVLDVVRHPGAFVRRVVQDIFRGKGPKNWVRSDARIREDVCEVLARNGEIDAGDIEVSVKDREVTLAGTVPNRRTKRLAENVLDDVLGVVDVHNRLTTRR